MAKFIEVEEYERTNEMIKGRRTINVDHIIELTGDANITRIHLSNNTWLDVKESRPALKTRIHEL